MITWTTLVGITVAGLFLLAVAGVLLNLLDSAQAGAWRRIAAERRATWERRQYALRRSRHVDAWADHDDL